MSGKKPAKKPAAPRKKSRGMRLSWLKVAGVLLLALALGAAYLVARNYHRQSVREALETVVGELDQEKLTIRAADPHSAQALLAKIKAVEDGSWGELKLSAPKTDKNSIRVGAELGRETFEIEIQWEGGRGAPPPAPTPRPAEAEKQPRKAHALREGAKLAIVIDDLGADLKVAGELFDLPYPVTPAILPHLGHSTELAKMALTINRPYLLHMPMEPKSAKENPGKGAILKGDSPEKVREKLAAALDSVAGAGGVNNHMGSKATESGEVMAAVMGELAKRDLFFLDSQTSAKSVGAEKARDAGMKWARRDVFLDNVADQKAITAKLDEALEVARKNGTAVAIGHGRPETLRALKGWADAAKESGVLIVPLPEVLHDRTLETN